MKTKEDIAKFKIHLKKLWDFQVKYFKNPITVEVPGPTGVKIYVNLFLNAKEGEIYVYNSELKTFTVSDKNIKKFIKYYCPNFAEDWHDMRYVTRMHSGKFISSIIEEYQGLLINLRDCDLYTFDNELDDLVNSYATFNDVYSDFLRIYREKNIPSTKEEKIRVNNDYWAHVKYNSDIIEVGCQKIPITAVREVVNAFNRLHKK